MRFASPHRVAFPALCLLLTACPARDTGAGANAGKNDPNQPAVVKLPQPILPGDTAKPDTTEATAARIQFAQSIFSQGYAAVSAGIAFHDRQLFMSVYAPDAVLRTPDSTFRGLPAIAAGLEMLARRTSMSELRRGSLRITVGPDSTMSDTGVYIITTQRPGGAPREERGAYRATWRIHPPPMSWALVSDRLYPPSPSPVPRGATKGARPASKGK